MQRLKYAGYDVVFQEVPREISLAIDVTNCPYRCRGCHSPYLQEDIGNYISDDLEQLLDKHEGLISCVCFMGGDQNKEDLKNLLSFVRSKGLKTCLYTGTGQIEMVADLLQYLDYIKIGPYIESLGGLNSPTTNQKMYHITKGKDGFALNQISFV